MKKFVAIALVCFAGISFAGDKGQAAKPQSPAAPSKGQETVVVKPANKIIVEQKVTEYAPVAKRRKLLYRPISSQKTIGEVVDCPNCKK